MRKVILTIDEEGNLVDNNGLLIWAGWGASCFVADESTAEEKGNIKKIIKLKEAGFTADEIIDMKNGGLL